MLRKWEVGMRGLCLLLATVLFVAQAEAIEILPDDSPVKLDLYGVILGNTYWNSNGLFGSDVPLWAVAPADSRAEDEEFGMTARQTRFGFRLKAPDVGSAKLSGVMEMDFFGGFPASGQAASFVDMRLRMAFVKLEWESTSFVAGQDWIILAPLNPTTLSHFAVAGLASSGNLWLRYPQLRVDHVSAIGTGKLGITAGILRPVGGSDTPDGGSLIDLGGAGERSGIPFTQARLFYSRQLNEKPLTLGFSAHYGKEEYKLGATATETDIDTWAVAGDFQVPIGNIVQLQGEFFSGSNLDSFQGGVNQGFSLNGASFPDSNTIQPIDSSGGWIQLLFTPQIGRDITFYIAYGIDNPDDADLTIGQRAENETIMAGFIYKLSKYFQTGFEYNRITTKYFSAGENDAHALNLAIGFWF